MMKSMLAILILTMALTACQADSLISTETTETLRTQVQTSQSEPYDWDQALIQKGWMKGRNETVYFRPDPTYRVYTLHEAWEAIQQAEDRTLWGPFVLAHKVPKPRTFFWPGSGIDYPPQLYLLSEIEVPVDGKFEMVGIYLLPEPNLNDFLYYDAEYDEDGLCEIGSVFHEGTFLKEVDTGMPYGAKWDHQLGMNGESWHHCWPTVYDPYGVKTFPKLSD